MGSLYGAIVWASLCDANNADNNNILATSSLDLQQGETILTTFWNSFHYFCCLHYCLIKTTGIILWLLASLVRGGTNRDFNFEDHFSNNKIIVNEILIELNSAVRDLNLLAAGKKIHSHTRSYSPMGSKSSREFRMFREGNYKRWMSFFLSIFPCGFLGIFWTKWTPPLSSLRSSTYSSTRFRNSSIALTHWIQVFAQLRLSPAPELTAQVFQRPQRLEHPRASKEFLPTRSDKGESSCTWWALWVCHRSKGCPSYRSGQGPLSEGIRRCQRTCRSPPGCWGSQS